jgi:small subunit ribosomal protein S1
VKVLDIDRDRQRISLGLKQTQSDPWQQVIENYHENDVVEGRVTKVVTFGAFVEILPGVEGLVHISELAQHHVENPREVVSQGQPVNVKIIEVDGERRRLSLSLKRVEDTDPVQPRADGGESVHTQPRPTIDLSEEVFAEVPVTVEGEAEEVPGAEDAPIDASFDEPSAEVETEPEPVAEEAPSAEVEAEPEGETVVEESPSAEADATGAGVAPAEEASDDAAEPEAEAAPAAEPEASTPEK